MIRIGTWNLENLFRPGDPDGPKDQATYDAKLTALADTITRINPDVLAVQEVGNPDALTDLVKRLSDGWEPPRTATVAGGPHPIRVGFLSRLPLQAVTEHWEFANHIKPVQVDDTRPPITRMGRAALSTRVTTLGGHQIDILTAHLKSKLLEFPPGPGGRTRFDTDDEDERARYAFYALTRRAAEAATVRATASALLAGHGQGRSLIVLGDLNDEPTAATTQILQGPPGSEIGTGGFTQVDRGDGQRLWNLAAYIPTAERFSRIYRGRGELIDHIFVSHALLGSAKDGAVRTDWTTHPTPSVTDQPRTNDAGSDHRPVVADFTLN